MGHLLKYTGIVDDLYINASFCLFLQLLNTHFLNSLEMMLQDLKKNYVNVFFFQYSS